MTATDSRDADRPPVSGDRYAAARWLLDRHPVLARLLGRLPELIDAHGDPDVDLLAGGITEYEQYVAAWSAYERRHPAPRDDLQVNRWQQAGPHPSPLVKMISCLSPSERARLRMLATFSAERVPLSVTDFSSLDSESRCMLNDWTAVVRLS